ncbi:MAG: DUF6364 family protein [Planctomycetota bacterium]|jgi:hypothetical protein
MATTKLTLGVEAETVERAKEYAARHHTSVSKIFTHYIDALSAAEEGELNIPRGSVLARVAGIAKGDGVASAEDLRYDALAEKYELGEST